MPTPSDPGTRLLFYTSYFYRNICPYCIVSYFLTFVNNYSWQFKALFLFSVCQKASISVLRNITDFAKPTKINSRIQYGSSHWEVFMKSRKNAQKHLKRSLFLSKNVEWIPLTFLKKNFFTRVFNGIIHVFQDVLLFSQAYRSKKRRSKLRRGVSRTIENEAVCHNS